MDVAQHVALCTRLSRFVQLQTLSEQDTTLLCVVCSDLVALYDREDAANAAAAAGSQQSKDDVGTSASSSLLGGVVSSATMDDIVLLATQKLLLGVVAESETRVKESVLFVLARTLARCERQMQAFNEQKLLGFLQSCALYLPVPDAAIERSATASRTSESEQRQHASRSLQTQSEELRLHVLTSLHALLRHRSPMMFLSTSSASATDAPGSDRIHFFAYVVSSLLHIAQYDRCRAAALLAVQTLARVVAFLQDAALLRQFFPGVSVGMWRTVNAPQQSSKVVAAALRCLAQSITLCISDAANPPSSAASAPAFSLEGLRVLAEQQHQQRSEDESDSEPTTPSVPADPWVHETAVNVDTILSKLLRLQLYQRSWRIRDAMVELCGAVVLSSRATLRDSFFRCYEELLVFRVDAIADVVASAQRVLATLQTALSTAEWLEMVPVLAGRFEMHLSTLSLQCGTDHESASVSLMRKLIGYVRFLGKRLGAHLDAAIDSIYAALCHVLEFDAIDIDLVLHQTLRAADASATGSLTTSQFQKRLRFFHEQDSVDAVTELLFAVGSVTTPALFIDCAFTQLSRAAPSRGAEVFVVLNGFLRAHIPSNPRDANDTSADASAALWSDDSARVAVDVHLVGRILEDLLELDGWSEHTNSSSQQQSLTYKRRKSDVAQRALMVECVGVCVEILQRDFSVFLLHTLYPLVEKLGSPDVEVERAALETLRKIAFFGAYASLEALLEANMDYFVDALCSRLEHLDAYPLTARVVEGLLRHTKIAALPLVDEVANSLLQSVDLHQDSPHIGSLLRAVKLLLSSMAADDVDPMPKQPSPSAVSFGTALVLEPPGSLLAQFIQEVRTLSGESSAADYDDADEDDADDNKDKHKDKDAQSPSSIEEIDAELDGDGDDRSVSDEVKMKGAMPVEYGEPSPIDSREDDDEDEQASEAPTSPYTALIIEILDRSGHFLSESEPIACCLVLSIIDEGAVLLQDARKELLPLIHRLWSAILHRLKVMNKPILTATVRLVTTLAVVAGDFIGDRFVETVWPALRPHLCALEPRASSGTTKLTRSMLLLTSPSSSSAMEPGDLHDRREDDEETEWSSNASALEHITSSHDGETLETATRARRTLDSQLLLASLECITTVARKSSAVTQIVPEIAVVCRQFLSSQYPRDVVGATKTLFQALAALNGDEVLCALAPLAAWTPPAPPSARFPAFARDATAAFYRAQLQHQTSHRSAGRASDSTAFARENAAWLIRELQRSP